MVLHVRIQKFLSEGGGGILPIKSFDVNVLKLTFSEILF